MQAVGGFRPSLCGAGLLWSWSYIFFFINQEGSLGPLFNDLAYLAAALATSAVVAGISSGTRLTRRQLAVLAMAGCASLVAGTVLTVFLSWSGLCAIAGKTLCGLGQALFWIAWGSLLTKAEIGQVESSVLLWVPMLAASALIASVSKTLPAGQLLFGLFACLLPPGSLAAYLRSSGDLAERPETAGHSGDGRSVSSWLQSEGLLARLASLAFASGALSLAMGTFGLGMEDGPSQRLLLFAVATAATFGVAWVSLRNTRRYDLTTLFRWSLPTVVVAVAVFVIGGPWQRTAAFLLITVASVGFEFMAKLYVVHMAERSGVDPTTAVAIGFAMPALGCIMPMLFWVALARGADVDPTASLMAVPVLFAFAVALIMGRDNEPERAPSKTSLAAEAGTANRGPAVEGLAAEAGLSPRETEVLAYLARGCSRTYIREELYLSKGTVDTHVNHIYRKLGISSKDELMRLVDARSV